MLNKQQDNPVDSPHWNLPDLVKRLDAARMHAIQSGAKYHTDEACAGELLHEAARLFLSSLKLTRTFTGGRKRPKKLTALDISSVSFVARGGMRRIRPNGQ